MAVSKTILFNLDGGVWVLADGPDRTAHRVILGMLYGSTGQFLHVGDGDTQLMIDVFAAFGFTIRFVGGTTDV